MLERRMSMFKTSEGEGAVTKGGGEGAVTKGEWCSKTLGRHCTTSCKIYG